MERRRFLQLVPVSGFLAGVRSSVAVPVPGGTLNPRAIRKYQLPLVIPPAMPPSNAGGIHYEIAVRQFRQQILPPPWPSTTVWSYGAVNQPRSFHYPAFTIEAAYGTPVRIRWINSLVDSSGRYLPHLLPVDPTLHWANPAGGLASRDSRPVFARTPRPYLGPVPLVTHVHGAHTRQESDGFTEAWYLPNATDIPSGYANTGTYYDIFKAASPLGSLWTPGSAVFEYPNDQSASTLWYHDHTLGMTRLNVYAGPAGFYIIRGGPGDAVGGVLPGPAPALGDAPGRAYYEIPVAIQDRSFNVDGSLFYPADRAFFEGLQPGQLQIPFIPEPACSGPSDISPIWNPEFFGNTMVVNGQAWPYLDVERRRYRFRFLNGCNSRFLILKFSRPVPMWQIGAEGGFLPAPVEMNQLLMAPAERADVIVDFSDVPVGTSIILLNVGPDEPFGGDTPGVDFEAADSDTTGQVMEFRVIPRIGNDPSTHPSQLLLPSRAGFGPPDNTRRVSLNEEDSGTVYIGGANGVVRLRCGGSSFGPRAALLGTLQSGQGSSRMWEDPITENIALNATEVWEIYNFTEDAHPIHIHQVMFEVLNRQQLMGTSTTRPPEPWELGLKDTVIAYPGEITRLKTRFDIAGRFVWHCHIVEHEDNEMMRPLQVG